MGKCINLPSCRQFITCGGGMCITKSSLTSSLVQAIATLSCDYFRKIWKQAFACVDVHDLFFYNCAKNRAYELSTWVGADQIPRPQPRNFASLCRRPMVGPNR